MKTQSFIRIVIFMAWLFFWALTSVLLLVAPRFRNTIDQADILPAIGSIASIWLPVLSCFAGFWFSHSERKISRQRLLSNEQVLGAIGLSLGYLAFVLLIICYSVYGVDYSSQEYRTLGNLPVGLSFREHLEQAVKMSLWISPLATAPVLALTGASSEGRPGKTKVKNHGAVTP